MNSKIKLLLATFAVASFAHVLAQDSSDDLEVTTKGRTRKFDCVRINQLNVCGTETVGTLIVTGNETVNTLVVTGNETVDGTATINTLIVTGTEIIGGNLIVTGTIFVGGSEVIDGNLTVDGTATVNTLVVIDNASVGGNLLVTGTIFVDGSEVIDGQLNVDGIATVNTLAVVLNETVGGNLIVTGTIFVDGSEVIDGNLIVGLNEIIYGNLDVIGSFTAHSVTASAYYANPYTPFAPGFPGVGGALAWGTFYNSGVVVNNNAIDLVQSISPVGFTHTPGTPQITATNAGIYLIVYSVTQETDTLNSYNIRNVTQSSVYSESTLQAQAAALSTTTTVSATGFLVSLAAGDVIEIFSNLAATIGQTNITIIRVA